MEAWKKNPYYITAYGLAVKHGFQGTEEEWLASLNGTDGSYMARIEKVSGTGAQGTTDTYQVILSDGSTAGTFEVYNGADGNATDIDKLRSQIGTMDKEKAGLAPKLPDETGTAKYLCQDGTWAVPPDTNTWVKMQGATEETDGSAGYVPAPPSDGHDRKYLRADGTWAETGDIEDPVEKSNGQILQFDAETGKWKAAKNYTLPVGGSAIGGVKNGGDIKIGSDGAMNIPDGNIGTSKIADGSVTRSKLANDVLYSPIVTVTAADTVLTPSLIGKTLRDSSNFANNNITIDYDASIPVGAEFAVLFAFTTSVTITFGENTYAYFLDSASAKKYSVAKRGMAALKKFASSGGKDYWYISGNVEVVS